MPLLCHFVMARDNHEHEQLCWPDYRVLASTASTRSDIPGAARHWTGGRAWSYFIKEESSKMSLNCKLALLLLTASQLIQNCLHNIRLF